VKYGFDSVPSPVSHISIERKERAS